MIRHLPFIEHLSKSDFQDEWEFITDGFLALRIFDDWVVSFGYGLTFDPSSYNSINIPGPVCSGVVSSLVSLKSADIVVEEKVSILIGCLLSYAEKLRDKGLQCLASDVYKTAGDAIEWGGLVLFYDPEKLKAIREAERTLFSGCNEYILNCTEMKISYYALESQAQARA